MNLHVISIRLSSLLAILAICTVAFAQKNTASSSSEDSPSFSVEFTPEGGFYGSSATVQMLCPGAAIYFTTNGALPRAEAEYRYTSPIAIEKTTVVRAVAMRGGEKSPVASATYFIDEPSTTFPVVSLSIAPGVLFNEQSGLFMKGPNAIDTMWQLPGANFWSRKEVGASVEFYDPNGKKMWGGMTGMRLFGGMSRTFPQKSLALVARSKYGQDRIRFPVFGRNGLKKFKYLVLRNSGSDFGRSHFRDALMTHLVADWDIDVQDYRPSHVYINGKYWGIYNLREKVNRYFINGHHNVDKDSLDIIEHRLTRRQGSTRHYQRMLNFIEKRSLADAKNYAWVHSQMEVNNFMDHQIAQIYFDNQDAGGNIKYWRPQTDNGRWRWILYDTDFGFGLQSPKAYKFNSLAFHTATNGPDWPNPPWSTLILRKLLENKDFQRRFINRFADYLNSDLEPEKVLKAIDKFHNRLQPEMPRHLDRWNLSGKTWKRDVETMRTFARERPAYMRKFLMQKFNTGELRNLHLDISHGGQVVINENVDFRDTFSGQYFEKIPIRLKAMPDLGYRFVRWQGQDVNSESPELLLELTHPDWSIQAVFEKYNHPLAGKIIINEVSCNNKHSGDWVELYNTSKVRVNLQNWILTDSKNEFRFPLYFLRPGGYVIVCEDSVKFVKQHPKALSVIGGLSFGLNKRRETIQLFSPEAAAVDSIAYVVEAMDTVFSLNLLLPTLDNGDPGNWEITLGNGSPDAANAYYVASSLSGKRSLWMQIGGAMGVLVLCLILLKLRRKGVL